MAQHLSVRVPWHDDGWKGNVCLNPDTNNSCLRLKNIYENRDDKFECQVCGQCMSGHEKNLPCIGEGGAFMSDQELVKTTVHPYKKWYSTHKHFLDTEIVYPPFTLVGRPYAWLLRKREKDIRDIYGIEIDSKSEDAVDKMIHGETAWYQNAANHRKIFDYFYGGIVPNESLCIAYAKQVPFTENPGRVIIGMGHITKVVPAVEHAHTNENKLTSMTWETMLCHSIRENHEDGFIIPYKEMMEYAQEHPEFDISTITVMAPDDAFDEFSFATEHVSHDSVIEVILSCIKAFEIINSCLEEDYSNVIDWLNARLAEVWKDRGAFPGLGAMLYAMGVPLGVVIAKHIKEETDKTGDDIWEYLDAVMTQPNTYLPSRLASKISNTVTGTWKNLPDERKKLFKLLSRFELSLCQAKTVFNQNDRQKADIKFTDAEVIENPYLLYEKTRLKNLDYFISVKKVDRAVFPVPEIADKYPVLEPSALDSDNDKRRIRAMAVAMLEIQANNGNTIYPCGMLVDKMQAIPVQPECKVTLDILASIEKFMLPEIIKREMKSGMEYYKLKRLNEFDEIIEKSLGKRIFKAPEIDIHVDWLKLLNEKFDKESQKAIDDQERRAREEKAAVLDVLAKSKISVLIGDAGTGKTTVLSVLCNEPSVKAGGVLLLAPTGKATVRLKESMGAVGENFTSYNVAQFLVKSKRFDWIDLRYKLSGIKTTDIPETVIVDEASMLTEEMFGALVDVIKAAKRIIFVGDPNQLPPIGAGSPFVDLVNLLKLELPANKFPRVCKSYGELTVNCRQGIARLDVSLSKMFTASEYNSDENVISDIVQGKSPHISIEKWSTKEELEVKLLEIVRRETGMKDVDDIDGFDASLGGKRADYATFFNVGCAEKADKWQILSPVRNMPQGVLGINRLIHQKYREKFLELSKQYGKYRKIPGMLGPDNIVYGDKVINVINNIRKAYDCAAGQEIEGYIANGEIGITCSCFGADKNKHKYLKVEFSSQKGKLYSYDGRDFEEESGTAFLELAYALTVHKAQGSQFNTVILVIAEPCRILSKEMLYTALTRQTKKIVILYNDEPYHLAKFASADNSDIARRFTDLFAPVFQNYALDGKDFRPNIKQTEKGWFDDRKVFISADGTHVRSKSEVIICDALYHNGVEYEYEPEVEIGGRLKRPDFRIKDEDMGTEVLWEHCGMLTNPEYARNWEAKKEYYEKHGYREGENLIVTKDEEDGSINSAAIEAIIKERFC